ncbi:hypothetical protein GW17_00035308 [Ensete ventricosum]|nr:hypothetical protein GW17_00035308 [Ensete ventricosum]
MTQTTGNHRDHSSAAQFWSSAAVHRRERWTRAVPRSPSDAEVNRFSLSPPPFFSLERSLPNTTVAAAVCRAGGEPLKIEEVVVAPPKAYEVRIKIICTSLCHSDVTIWSIKVSPAPIPCVPASTLPLTIVCSPRRRIPPASPKFSATRPSGTRFVQFDIISSSAGGRRRCWIDLSADASFRVVESVGEHVEEVSVGDTVLSCFLAHCGDCVDCRSERSNVCSGVPLGLADGVMPRDGTSRFTDASGATVQHFLNVSSFSEYTVVDVTRVVKVAAAMPPEKACLLSCGVSTGKQIDYHELGHTILRKPFAMVDFPERKRPSSYGRRSNIMLMSSM